MKCVNCGGRNTANRKACTYCELDPRTGEPPVSVEKRAKPKTPVQSSEEKTGVVPHAQLYVCARNEFRSAPGDEPPHMGVLLEIEASGKPIVQRTRGAVAHVILALDLSASMDHPDKYPVLRDAVGGMLDDLCKPGAADVLVSVVIFSMGASVLIRSKPARRIGKEAFFRALEQNRLCFGRYTDVAGGLSRAGRIAYDQSMANALLPTRVYLLTDGKPQDMKQAREVAERMGKVNCDVHALAFGVDADVRSLQELIAGRRGGTVKSVRRETLGSAFERVAELSQKVLATRCLVSVDLDPGVVGGDAFRYRPARVRFPEPAFRSGKRFSADLGTIEMGRTYSLLLEVRPQETEDIATRLGTVTVQIPGHGGPITETIEMSIDRTPAGTPLGGADKMVRTARDILSALTDGDPETAMRALKLRKELYVHEKRDPALIGLIDKAIDALRRTGSLDSLSAGDYATLMAHTCTSGIPADRVASVG